MRQPLALHPQSKAGAVAGIAVDLVLARPGRLSLSFAVSGDVGKIALPEAAAPRRADALWRRTCFEAFIQAANGGAYYEWNFSPSSEWAVYRFDGYREGMRAAPYKGDPDIVAETESALLTLGATVDLLQLPALDLSQPLHLGLSAIIAEKNGTTSYWAAAHPPGKPDFHHADCFAVELSGSEP
jgi:hypothetical protein